MPPSSSPPSESDSDELQYHGDGDYSHNDHDEEEVYENMDAERLRYIARMEDDTIMESKPKDSDGGNLPRPSEYLRKQCPLCFGGKYWHDPKSE